MQLGHQPLCLRVNTSMATLPSRTIQAEMMQGCPIITAWILHLSGNENHTNTIRANGPFRSIIYTTAEIRTSIHLNRTKAIRTKCMCTKIVYCLLYQHLHIALKSKYIKQRIYHYKIKNYENI
jgi:hypothetical protein